MARFNLFISPGDLSATSLVPYQAIASELYIHRNGVGCDWQGHGYRIQRPMINHGRLSVKCDLIKRGLTEFSELCTIVI